MEKHTSEIAGAASKFEQAIGALPNAKLPVANQLEQAISTIKGNVKVILDTQVSGSKFTLELWMLNDVNNDNSFVHCLGFDFFI